MTKSNYISTERLILRRFCTDDLQDLYEYLSDREVVRFEPYKPMSLQETAENLEWRICTDEMIAVQLKKSGKMIGNVYLGKRDFDSFELGYVFNRNFWGCGYATEACRALIDRAFVEGAHRIYAECDPENEASWRLLKKLEFEREAHLHRNMYFWTDERGAPVRKDTFVYAALNKK